MIINRTPFRVSFFGGGTDYPVWYRENGGAVLGTTIDKYCYITCRTLPPFFTHKHRIAYSQIELVQNIDEIDHPAVRECFRFMNITRGLEVHHDADLPARTGLGSSSAFTVGLLNALYSLKGQMRSKMDLARDAIHVEQNLIKENVGSQDQVLVAIGGFNRISFSTEGNIEIQPVSIPAARIEQLQSHLMLIFSGFSRKASEIAAVQIRETPNHKAELKDMYHMVDEAIAILNSSDDISAFGRLLHRSWQLKRRLSNSISNKNIDSIYETALNTGALGGKLLGAGGGGFILLFTPPEVQPRVRQHLHQLLHVPFRFDKSGSQIVFYEPDVFNTT